MELLKIIKEFIIKLWNWLINLFFKHKETNLSNKKKKNKHIKNKTLHRAYINHNEENDNIINLYTGVLPKELEIINNKLDTIRKKVIKNNDEDIKKELNTLNNIGDLITEQKIFINNFEEIKSIIDNTLFDEDLHLNTQEKISLLKENIEELIDENLDTYEKNIIKKAYYEYEKVNYVIITTMIIDDIYNDLQKLNDKSLKNQHNKEYFIRKIKEIEEKIEHIKTLNTKEEVVRELENLKNDVYTKRKDKYDLLYNSEIFTNLKRKCNDIIINIENKEIKSEEVKRKKRIEEDKKEQLKKQELQKELEKKQEEIIEEQKETEKIKKRFMDMELARQIILMRELMRLKKDKNDLVKDTLESYQDFLVGENHQFNFSRNKIKTEVAKLYNDTLHNICIIEKTEYVPVEHINIKLSDLTSETLKNQERLNNLILINKKTDINEDENSIKVNQKLNYILEKEKIREESMEKPKIYKKEYKPIKKNDDKNSQKNKNNRENLN